MQTSQRYKNPNLDNRMKALGVIGSLVLAGVFFCFGWLYIGPKLRSAQPPQPAHQAPRYVPPRPPRAETPQAAEPREPPALDVEITEQSADSPGSAETPAAETSPRDAVSQDGDSLTVTLDPTDGGSEPSRDSSNSEEAGSRTGRADQGLPPPRAATESESRTKSLYRVQVGTFTSKGNADNLAADLRERGYRPYIKAVKAGEETMYRVQVGVFRNKEDAYELAGDLSKTGFSPSVIRETEE